MGIFDRKIQVFTDGAVLAEMLEWRDKGIKGFTTNPTLMKKAEVVHYEAFAKEVLKEIPDLPISFEVFADEFSEMERQARLISAWGKNVYVKIPITNTKGESSAPLIARLSEDMMLNVTAILTLSQVKEAAQALSTSHPSIISVFAGRIADTQRDPVPIMSEAARWLKENAPRAQLLWASPREVLNVNQAEECGCQIITATPDVLKKLELQGKPLDQYSLETVQMFFNDGQEAGYQL
ncbi:transaldolase [Candidatus Berkelbacteria bacterium]|nr:transaldolase [Candidatus Berkelbacteria bacterium]